MFIQLVPNFVINFCRVIMFFCSTVANLTKNSGNISVYFFTNSIFLESKGKLAPKRKREEKSPLATRNTMIRACHKIRKGENEPSATAMNSKKPCKCLTGWKKSKNKETDQSNCDRVSRNFIVCLEIFLYKFKFSIESLRFCTNLNFRVESLFFCTNFNF